MAGFRKAQPKQAFLKLGLYGPPGSGKTFTGLLLAEGLADITGKRIAFVDTEHGTDFYAQDVATRSVHPNAFDFDALYTRSIMDTMKEIRDIDANTYGIIIIDSISHLWEASISAYRGKMTRADTIPFHAWAQIKKPYKSLMSYLLSFPGHVIICGRQGNEYGEDENTGELKKLGVKMKAEGETPYEPHILIRMEAQRSKGNEKSVITAYVEKDRTGVLSGQTITMPTFDNLAAPIMPLLGIEQARIATEDETAAQDAEMLDDEDRAKNARSQDLLEQLTAKISLATTADELKAVGKEITKEIKAQMSTQDVAQLRDKYLEREAKLK